ncbi:hypothetical protein BDY24DRAFT_403381 [Mrakia frigida]|uniref:Mzm1p n=1 Tax=Mrakia frigida TaxID=29902 RepID=UPI003FCBF326
MSSAISSSLQAQGRSAYRHVLRSSRVVFKGDPKALTISHQKLREAYELEANRSESDPTKYQERIKMAKEVGDILLKNVVQGEKKPDSEVYDLKIRSTTELGDNDSIKKKQERKKRTETTSFPNRGRPAPPTTSE